MVCAIARNKTGSFFFNRKNKIDERDKIRPYHEMVARFALALKISSDELLGLNAPKRKHKAPSLRLQKRMIQIEELPAHQKKILLKTIDTILNAVQK